MLDLNINNLLEYLREQNIPAQKQVETNQIVIIFKADGQDFPIFLRTVEETELLQLLAFIPGNIKEGHQADVARFLHHLNRQLDIPGFGMDEHAGVMFYRYMLAAPGKKVGKSHLKTLIKSVELLCQAFSPLLLSVASGRLSLKDSFKKLEKMEQLVEEEKSK